MDSLPSRIRLVHTESERLARYLGTLSPDAWLHPSACAGWEVGDVVAHLTRGAEAYIEWITRGLQGDTAPPLGVPAAGTGEDATSAVRRAQRARDVHARLGDQLFTTFQARTDQFNALVADLSTPHWTVLCYHPTRLRPVRDFVALRLTELVLHGWDIESRLESSAHLSAESLPVCLELLPDMLAWAFHPGPSLPAPVRCRLVGADQAPHRYELVSTGNQAWLVAPEPERTPVSCQCDTETFVLLMSGRLSMPVARVEGRLRLEGDTQLMTALTHWFQGN